MQIFQVINVRWYNATSWYALYLSKLLQDAGHDVLVITVPNSETYDKAIELGLNVKAFEMNSSRPVKLFKACKEVVSLINKYRPDIVNCHRGELFFWWGLLRKFGMNFKLVRTRGDQRLPKSDFFNRYLHSNVADAVVVTNKRMADHFLKKMELCEQKLWLILGGVDNKHFHFNEKGRKEIRKQYGYKESDTVIGMLGRFDRVKGQKELIEAINKIRSSVKSSNPKLLLLGYPTATTQHEIETWIRDNKIEDITTISGKCDDISAAISAIDIGVVASLWSETIARAALEIMSCKRPLISTSVGVMPDLLPDEALCKPQDPSSLAKLLKKAIESPEFRVFLLKEHNTTMSQLSGSDFLKRTLTLYNNLLRRD